jgi:hypothetical protein
MRQLLFLLTLAVGLWPAVLGAQSSSLPSSSPSAKPAPPPELLGATFAQVPEVVYFQIPALPKNQGVLIQDVTKNSVAEKIGLRRNDIILSYGKMSVQDAKQLVGLVSATPLGQPSKFVVLRGGKSVPIQYAFKASDLPAVSLVKPNGPPAVNLEVEPLANDRMKINFTCYAGGTSKLQTFTCEGTVEEIAKQLDSQREQIPAPVQELLDVAVKRLRLLKSR